MSGNARGGNDKLISGTTGNEDMWGDAQIKRNPINWFGTMHVANEKSRSIEIQFAYPLSPVQQGNAFSQFIS